MKYLEKKITKLSLIKMLDNSHYKIIYVAGTNPPYNFGSTIRNKKELNGLPNDLKTIKDRSFGNRPAYQTIDDGEL